MSTFTGRFQSLNDAGATWATLNPVLQAGELAIADPGSSTPIIKCGDGYRPWSALPALNAPVDAANDYVAGITTTLPPGSSATVVIDNTVDPPTINFGLPSGPAGPPNSLTMGSVTTGAPGSPAAATITGAAPNQMLNLTIPTGAPGPTGPTGATGAAGADGVDGVDGAQGPPNTLSIGTVTTGAPGSPAAASITGAAPNQTLNLSLPQGATGPTGPQGPQGEPGTAAPLGNPTASIGLAAINGVSTTGMRADAAPALSQAIAPTWTAQHVFTGSGGSGAIRLSSANPGLVLTETDAGVDTQSWRLRANGNALTLAAANDTFTAQSDILIATRTGLAVSQIRFGGTTDNPSFAFLGTGTATFNGTVDLLGPLKASGVEGIVGQVLSAKGPGLPPEWRSAAGGTVEMDWNFSISTLNANPGSQKLGFNAASYTGTTALYINALALGNVDAGTILSLLQAGNRIYLQQRNDSTKAVVYEVTAPGTNNTGWWSIPVTHVNSKGVLFPANADLEGVFMLSVSSSASANPTASVGLAAVNGSATTWMRSDAAPALDVAISPTWSGAHTFLGLVKCRGAATPNQPIVGGVGQVIIGTENNGGALGFANGSAATNQKYWDIYTDTAALVFRTIDDALSSAVNWLSVGRSGNTITTLQFGNAGNNPVYTFLGSGATNIANPHFNAQINFETGASGYMELVNRSAGALGLKIYHGAGGSGPLTTFGADASLVLGAATGGSQGAGTLNATGLYINGVAVSSGSGASGANPSASVGLAAVNGSAGTFMRSDAAPALSVAISPTWSGAHTWSQPLRAADGSAAAASYSFTNAVGTGLYLSTTNTLGLAAAGILAAAISSGGATFNVTLAVTAGSAGLAAYHFPGDNGTGLWSSAAGALDFACSGGNRMQLTSTTFTLGAGIAATFQSSVTAVSFTTSSARATKRETGAPRYAADILARLRPLLYRLLTGDDREQLGLIAEEVHEVCPQLSDGKTVAYDRLAILLLAAWQDDHARAA